MLLILTCTLCFLCSCHRVLSQRVVELKRVNTIISIDHEELDA